MISSVIFCILFIGASAFFYINAKKIRRNIFIGRDFPITDHRPERLKTMVLVALGQSKMVTRPISAIMHILVYVGFVLINIEVLEMFIDGIFNSHRAFSFLGGFYNFLIGFFEILALGVFIWRSCILVKKERSESETVFKFRTKWLAAIGCEYYFNFRDGFNDCVDVNERC